MGDRAVIKTDELRKVYGMGDIQVRALDSVSLTISEGEFVGIMGPSGSGKSTFMNIIGCLDRPSEGFYYLDGEDVSKKTKTELAHIRNKKLGFIFQAYNLLGRTTAVENVILPLMYNREVEMSRQEMIEKARHALEMVGLADRMDHQPHELSGGQQQRVAIARALVNDPVLILADEPTGNLDTRSGTEIMDMLHNLHAEGRTIVMVTHDPEIADEVERVVSLRDGLIETDQHNGKNAGRGIPEGVAA
jgi:putative ABC transport system ATP-binding protein